jgi:uncharacterized heparinase superfamily protein
MSGFLSWGRIRNLLRKRPSYVARRVLSEARAEAERVLGPRRANRLTAERLVALAGVHSVDELWGNLKARPYPHPVHMNDGAVEALIPKERHRVTALAEMAARHEVDILGSGRRCLGAPIDWHRDFKTGLRWPPRFHRDIEYNNLDRPSDVKVAWELSRFQWVVPLGQAWLLTREHRYAEHAKALVESWIDANPYGGSVNWACTMEPALRILTWTWLFHAFSAAPAWGEEKFRAKFLRSLYLHGDFVARNLERGDINGNHFTADAAGLVYAGLFFGDIGAASHWHYLGWTILEKEIQLQVWDDGVDFEASVPYHRLVMELFSYPALYRKVSGQSIPAQYLDRLERMGQFVSAYTRPDGSSPVWGDSDNGRALAFGGQGVNDHRYLVGVLADAFSLSSLRTEFYGPFDEVLWLLGVEAVQRLREASRVASARDLRSCAFPKGGFFILRSGAHHIFVDCGPIGLAGRGGHGHNDLLSFEAVLHETPIFVDAGCYVYTASPVDRNAFRSTSYHNTPQVDGQEINRFIDSRNLWTLRNDAAHQLRAFQCDATHSVFEGAHDGYCRLADPVRVIRRIELEHATGTLRVADRFEGIGNHVVTVPFHLAPSVEIGALLAPGVMLHCGTLRFALTFGGAADWLLEIDRGRISNSYGHVTTTSVLKFRRHGALKPLTVTVEALT